MFEHLTIRLDLAEDGYFFNIIDHEGDVVYGDDKFMDVPDLFEVVRLCLSPTQKVTVTGDIHLVAEYLFLYGGNNND